MIKNYKCYIDNNTLCLETSLGTVNSSAVFYLDKLSNISKIHEENESEHCKVVKTGGYTQETVNSVNVIKIDITDMEVTELIVTIKTTDTEHYLAYDAKNLHDKLYSLLTVYCTTCLDKSQKTKIASCLFRFILMQQACDLDEIEKAAQLYKDLDRILNLTSSCTLDCANNVDCKVCHNGVCTL